jgi:hypothetical protein
VTSGLKDLAHVRDHFELPPAAFRQLGAGGPLRMVVDPSQKRIFDAFSRDEQTPDRRTTDKLRANISTAEDAVVSQNGVTLPPAAHECRALYFVLIEFRVSHCCPSAIAWDPSYNRAPRVMGRPSAMLREAFHDPPANRSQCRAQSRRPLSREIRGSSMLVDGGDQRH